LKILALTELQYPHGSGAELATSLWIKCLAESGFQVRVITSIFPGEPERSSSGTLEIFRLPLVGSSHQKYWLLGRSSMLFSSFFRKSLEWADLVYIPRLWYSAIPFAKGHGKPVVTHLHDYIPICSLATRYDLSRNEDCIDRTHCRPSCIIAHERAKGSSFLQTYASTLLNYGLWPHVGRSILLSDAIVCISEAQQKILTTSMPSLLQKSRLIHNLLPEVSATAIGGKDLGYFGGPQPLKGYKVLTRAMGHTKTPLRVHATSFERKTSVELPNGSRLLLYGRLPEPEYEEIYWTLRTVIVPSIWAEPLPYVVSEAILRGRLVIASNIGGIPEQTAHCPGAFLVPPNDYLKLSELIEFVSELDKESASDLALKNSEVFLKRFDNSRNVERFVGLLQELCST
jgi:glycosyltransferase involved in cell wall biosynthesis